MKLRDYDLFKDLALIIFFILLILSTLFDVILLGIYSICLYFVTIIFYLTSNLNSKFYSVIAIFTLLGLLTYSFLNQNLDLINKTYILTILGGIALIIAFSIGMKKRGMIRESLRLIGTMKFEEALDKLNEILKSYPKDYNALYYKAVVLGSLERYMEQLELSDKLIRKNKEDLFASNTELDEKDILGLNIKIKALLKLKRFGEAEELIENILKKQPKNGGTLANKAYLLSEYGQYKEAVDHYEDALEIMYDKINKLENSRKGKILAESIPLDYGLDNLLISAGKVYEKLQEYEDALSCFDEALEIRTDSIEALKAKEEVLKLMENNKFKN